MTNKTDKQTEADRAKVENQTNKIKQRHEDKEANWESPEQLRKDGGDVHPTQQVVPNQPNPADDPALANTRYDPSTNGAKEEK